MPSMTHKPGGFFVSLYRHRMLLAQLTRREIAARYKGTMLGMVWPVLVPVFMLCVYTFVFSVIFRARWGEADSPVEFAPYLFCGLIVYAFFAECAGRAPSLFVSQPNYITKIIFPLEILPAVALGSALFNAALSACVLILFLAVSHLALPLTVLLLPVVLAPLCLLTCACALGLATLGVYVRDMDQLMSILLTVLMFLSPIFYPLSAVPEEFRKFLLINPLAPVIAAVRDVLGLGNMPDWSGLAVYTLAALAALEAAWWFYAKARKGFADVV